ncbi:9106_t:CDS:2, partial [Scutellospora calospora]
MKRKRPKQHRLTVYIEVLKEKSNDYNHFAICLACKEAEGFDYAYSHKFINTKRLVKTHLKNCKYFKNQKGEHEVTKIINDTNISSDESDSQTSNKDNTEIEQEQQGPLDPYIVRRFSKARKSKFNYLLLKMTVSNRWSFRWVENPDSLAPFQYINPKITLPGRKQLSGKILNEAVTEF